MIHQIEIWILELIRWYFNSSFVFAIPSIVLIIVLLFLQFSHQNKNPLPGIGAILLCIVEFFHLVEKFQVRADLYFTDLIHQMEMPSPSSFGKLPFGFEQIFTIFVGKAETRTYLEELIFVIFATYLILFLIEGRKDYKRTGVILGDFSIKDIVSGFNNEDRRPIRSKSNELGSGDLANTDQIIKWTKPSGSKGDTCLPVTDLRGSDGISLRSGELVWPAGERNRHILAIAKTGSGKTSRLILPILYSDCLCKDRSTIVIDSKPEMWRKLARMTREYNPEKNIMLFNPLDISRSMSWNILSKIEDDTDCKLIANTLIMATENPSAKGDSPFFRNNALSILNAIMVGLLRDPDETLSMPRIHELVQSGMKPLCDWMESHPEAFRTSRTFVELARSESQNADTIMSELGSRLSAWDLHAVRATTAKDELDIKKLITEPTLFIVEFRESELEMLRPLANVIVIELLRFLTKQAEFCPGSKLPRPVGLVIDEFASALGRLPDIHVKLNTLRSRNVSIVAAIQSIAQIKSNYGDTADSVLAGFSSTILMPSLDVQDAEWASKESGQMTIRFQTASTGSNRKIIEWFASKNVGSQEQVQQRAVLTPDEIGRPADNRATFFMPNTPPFQGFLVPFFKIPEMLKRLTEFDNDKDELFLRDAPIDYVDAPPAPPAAKQNAAASGGLPAGISNTAGWTDEQLAKKLDEVRASLDWDNTTGSARKWWEAFENENKHRLALVLRLAEELANRKATITEFFLAYVYSNTDNIQANLYYLDYSRLKKEEERKRKEAAAANP